MSAAERAEFDFYFFLFSSSAASSLVSVMETGGVVGSFMAIRASDAYIRKVRPPGDRKKRRPASLCAHRPSASFCAHQSLFQKPRCNNPRLPCILILSMIACNATYLMAKHADSEQKVRQREKYVIFYFLFFSSLNDPSR